MRIAVLTNAYPPETKGGAMHRMVHGGAGRIAELQVQMLEKAGHEVKVFCPSIHWLHYPKYIQVFFHLMDFRPRQTVVDDIIAWKPEVLVTHNLTGCGFGTPKSIQKQGVRWIHVLHDVQLFQPSGQVWEGERAPVWQGLLSCLRRQAFGQPNLVLSPTAWLLNEHKRHGFFLTGQNEVLPNPGPTIELTERALHDPLRLLFVGHVSRAKGAEFLYHLLNALSFPSELHVIGEGPGIFELKNAKIEIKLYGTLPPEEVLRLMGECDILLVPSQIQENQPTVILEAAAVGLPVIASDVGGVRETLDGAGRICPPRDIESWKKAIGETIKMYAEASQRMYMLAKKHDPQDYAQRFVVLVTAKR